MTTIETTSYQLRGEVDLATAPQLVVDLVRLAQVTNGVMVVDCAELSFIDSSGVAALLRVERKLRTVGRSMRLLHLRPMQRRVIEILGLTEILGVE